MGFFITTIIQTILTIVAVGAISIAYLIGMYKCLQKTSCMGDKPWMIFIPFANLYAIAKMLQEYRGFENGIVWFFTLAPIGVIIPIVGPIIIMAWFCLYMMLWIKFLDSFEASAGLIISFMMFPPAFGFMLANKLDELE